MKINEFLAILMDAGRETAKELKSTGEKLEFYLKVITSILAVGDVRIELEDGLRDLKVKQVAADIRAKLKAQQA
jgi:hypothetical protein